MSAAITRTKNPGIIAVIIFHKNFFYVYAKQISVIQQQMFSYSLPKLITHITHFVDNAELHLL